MKRDEREKQLHNALGRLAKDVNQLKERCKVMDIKISRIQDETAKLLAQFPRIHVCRHAHNQGYGAALRTAFQYS